MKFHRNSKYEVSSAEFAICQQSQEYCAIATSQLIEVVTWHPDRPTLMSSLRAHTRVVTDIDWHSKIPHLLASCSIDTFTHLWDLREPRKPILSLSAVCMSGATQGIYVEQITGGHELLPAVWLYVANKKKSIFIFKIHHNFTSKFVKY
jgi:WD40 repeat protein